MKKRTVEMPGVEGVRIRYDDLGFMDDNGHHYEYSPIDMRKSSLFLWPNEGAIVDSGGRKRSEEFTYFRVEGEAIVASRAQLVEITGDSIDPIYVEGQTEALLDKRGKVLFSGYESIRNFFGSFFGRFGENWFLLYVDAKTPKAYVSVKFDTDRGMFTCTDTEGKKDTFKSNDRTSS